MKLLLNFAGLIFIATKTLAFAPRSFRHASFACFALTPDQPAKVEMTDQSKRIYEYMHRISALSSLMNAHKDRLREMKEEMIELKNIEISDPSVFMMSSKSSAFKNALAEVKAALDTFGASSPEAKHAWDKLHGVDVQPLKVEESGSQYRFNSKALHSHHNYIAVVDTAMLSDAITAFEMIDSVANLIDMENDLLYNYVWKNYQSDVAP